MQNAEVRLSGGGLGGETTIPLLIKRKVGTVASNATEAQKDTAMMLSCKLGASLFTGTFLYKDPTDGHTEPAKIMGGIGIEPGVFQATSLPELRLRGSFRVKSTGRTRT